MKTIKLTKPYILEGMVFDEGSELVIASDGVDETVNETSTEPENEVDFGLNKKEVTDENEVELKEAKITFNTLVNFENSLWDELDVESGGELKADEKKFAEYTKRIKEFLEKKGVTEISNNLKDKLTDENYHTLVLALEQIGF